MSSKFFITKLPIFKIYRKNKYQKIIQFKVTKLICEFLVLVLYFPLFLLINFHF